MNVTIKGEPTTIEAYMIGNMTLCPPNHIKFARFAFNCETIEDADGTIFHKERKGRWLNDRGLYRCSSCNQLWTEWWVISKPIERMKKECPYCPMCGSYNGEETENE